MIILLYICNIKKMSDIFVMCNVYWPIGPLLICTLLFCRYGRKLVFFATMAVQTVFSLIQAASNSWEMFCVLYFIVGLGQIANYCAAFILGEFAVFIWI